MKKQWPEYINSMNGIMECSVGIKGIEYSNIKQDERNSGAQFEGDLGKILAIGAEISPYIGLGEKWESLSNKKKDFFF